MKLYLLLEAGQDAPTQPFPARVVRVCAYEYETRPGEYKHVSALTYKGGVGGVSARVVEIDLPPSRERSREEYSAFKAATAGYRQVFVDAGAIIA